MSTTTRSRPRIASRSRRRVTADNGNVVFSSTDERRTEELKGVNGTYGHVATVPLKGVAPGRYVLRSRRSRSCRTAPRHARSRVHRTLMEDVETIARGDDSRLVEPRRFLIRDRQAFSAVWAAHAGPNARAGDRFRIPDGRRSLCRRASHARVHDRRSPARGATARPSWCSSTNSTPIPRGSPRR